MKQQLLTIATNGRGFIEITSQVNQVIAEAGYQLGLCHLFIQHTSASLIITENADGNVLRDIENYFQRSVIDDDVNYLHRDEGADDMSAHIRCLLTSSSQTIPIRNAILALGTWQGVFLYEHRFHSFQRQLVITLDEG